MLDINYTDKVKEFDPMVYSFIDEMIDIFRNNGCDYDYCITPKTAKSFRLVVVDPHIPEDKQNIVATEEFKATDIKGTNGTFKVARMISYLDLISM